MIEALIWTGDYDSLVEIAAPEYTTKVIRAFQRKHGFFPTGVLGVEQRRLLVTMANEFRAEVGAANFSDPRAGIRLVVPTKYITDVVPTTFGMSLKGSVRGPFHLRTFALPGGRRVLEELYDAARKTIGGHAAEKRFHRLYSDRMVVVRIHSPLRTYAYARLGPTGGIKGFIMTWSLQNTELLHRVTGAAANTLTVLPGHPSPAPRPDRRAGNSRIQDASHEADSAAAIRFVIDELTTDEVTHQ
jgi:hypothetical protein